MRCIAANRSVLTALDQNTTLADYDRTNCTATTDEIDSMDIIQFADGWYSYPDLNTFDSDLLLETLTIRVIIYDFLVIIVSINDSCFSILNHRKLYHHGM